MIGKHTLPHFDTEISHFSQLQPIIILKCQLQVGSQTIFAHSSSTLDNLSVGFFTALFGLSFQRMNEKDNIVLAKIMRANCKLYL